MTSTSPLLAVRRSARWIIPAVSALALIALAPDLLAQEADPAEKKTFFDIVFKDGGFLMYPLALCSIAWLGLTIYNAMSINKNKFLPEELKAVMLDHMANVRVRSAIEVASSSPSFFGRMMAMALPHSDATDVDTLGRAQAEDVMADFITRENRGHMVWIGYFSILAQVAPMIGLLGTVQGMIGAFADLVRTKGADPSLLAGNISIALYTTFAGLVIAIPSVITFFIFKNKLNKLTADCHLAAGDLFDAALNTINPERQLAKVPEGLSAS